jgi:methyltransferase
MTAPPSSVVVALLVIFGSMALEARRSAANEQVLRRAGARPVADPSYPWMRVVYPLGFLLVCAEGWWRAAPWDAWALGGLGLFLAGKALKYAAIAALGVRWSFQVLVLPGTPLVTRGIYRHLRHPNYLGVVGEVLGSAVWLHAAIAGTLFAVSFGLILLLRLRVEERALGLAPRA